MEKEKIVGFDVCTCIKQELLNNIFEDYKNGIQSVVVNINPEIVINNYNDEAYRNRLNEQKYQIPDGIGIVFASKLNMGKIKNRIAGIDLMNDILEKSTDYNAKVFLYGAKPDVIKMAEKEIIKNNSNIKIVGSCDGYISENEALDIIKKANPDILFVGIGSPKQENFIINNKDTLKNIKIFMPVGGSFDVISKSLKRAPKWMIKLNIEWLFRLIQQPSRFFRQLKLIKFIYLVFISKIKHERRK